MACLCDLSGLVLDAGSRHQVLDSKGKGGVAMASSHGARGYGTSGLWGIRGLSRALIALIAVGLIVLVIVGLAIWAPWHSSYGSNPGQQQPYQQQPYQQQPGQSPPSQPGANPY